MIKYVKAVVFFASLTLGVSAQTNVTTSGGTTNAVPKFSGSATLANSAIVESSGNVGIGTSSPSAILSIAGSNSSGGLGLNVTNSSSVTSDGSPGTVSLSQIGPTAYWGIENWSNASLLEGAGLGGLVLDSYSSGAGIVFQTQRSTHMVLTSTGYVGIGTTSPGAKLEVNGNIKLTSNSGASLTFPDNTVQSTAWTGTLYGGDYAESVDVVGERKDYEVGDVLVLDPTAAGKFLKVTEPYSTLVAGIYSTKPGIVGRRQKTDPKLANTEVPMAMVGVVPTKVTAENGPIKVGDLLVTSSTAGHAMKGTDRSQMLGAVVGKAMGNLTAGTGVIEVLVTLQ